MTLRASSIARSRPKWILGEGETIPGATAEDEDAMGYGKTVIHWRGRIGLALALCLTGGLPGTNFQARAQTNPAATGPRLDFRLLNEDEGRTIADAARDHDQPTRGEQDCSHVVHRAYLNAGYEYSYASSFELYAGHENFERVRNPQPGDLVVWPGHVGIVLEPMEHSFYSLVSTGLEAQNYQGAYWRSRGRPRFFRYKVETTETLTATKTAVPPRASNSTKPQDTEAVIEERTPVATIDSNRPPKIASEKNKVVSASSIQPVPALAVEKTAFEVPLSIVIAAGNKLPTNSQVAEGISELSNASGTILRADDPKTLTTPLVIFERLRVERLDIKRDHGWARLQID